MPWRSNLAWPSGGDALGRLFEAAPGFIAILHGPEHRWVFANRAFERLFPDRVRLGEPARASFPEEELRGLVALMNRVYATGERFVATQQQVSLQTEDDQPARELFLDFVYEPIRDADGTVGGLFVEGFDATERVRAEAALREREERYRSLFNSIDEGFCIIDVIFEDGRPVDYRFLETNATFERQTGLAGALGRTARELIPALEQHWFDIYGRVAATGEALRFIDGSAEMGRWFDVYATRVGGEESRRVALLFSDITVRRGDEAERERLLAAERAARAEAEEAVRARDTFLSIAAHELRTPLTTLKGLTQLLQRQQARGTLGPERLSRTLHTLDRAADRLVTLTGDLLDVARIRTGQLPLTPQPTDLGALVGAAVAQARDRAGDGHRLSLDAPADLPSILADAGRIEQVLTNLLDNAVKYSPEGGAVAVSVAPEGDGATVAVQDAGIGLPADALEAIFEPFGRAANAAESRLPGMGLGLFICRTIVERHGGWIRAASPGEGRGTTVSLWLPSAGPRPESPAGSA